LIDPFDSLTLIRKSGEGQKATAAGAAGAAMAAALGQGDINSIIFSFRSQ